MWCVFEDSTHPTSLRFFPVSRYRDYLVFYRPIPEGIEVYRELHGARDTAGILTEEFGISGDDDAGNQETDE
jgi:hypothetical protein